MEKFDLIKKYANEKNGYITAKDIVDLGVSKQSVANYVKEARLEKVKHGIYILPEVFEDRMFTIQLSSPKAIFSHETALFLHDLTDRDPLYYVATVPRKYNATHLKKQNMQVYSIKPELYLIGEMQMETPYRNFITCYNAERTLCDVINLRAKIDIAIITDAYKIYTKRNNKNIHRLMQYAKMFGVEKHVRKYLEVLL